MVSLTEINREEIDEPWLTTDIGFGSGGEDVICVGRRQRDQWEWRQASENEDATAS